MKREFLKDLGLEDGAIDKIMSEYGKSIASEKQKVDDLTSKLEGANTSIEEYKEKLVNLEKVTDDSSKIKEELENLKKSIAEREEADKARAKEDALNKNINEVIGDKKFINNYTKDAIINEIKTALNDEANTGKSISDLFTNITKDQKDIFVSENQFKDMAGMGDSEQSNNKKETPFIW